MGKYSFWSRRILFIIFALAFNICLQAQKKIVLPLWPEGHPESNGITEPEKIEGESRLLNISEAAMTIQLPKPELATGAAVIICPGGGYARQAIAHEGFQVADWLNEHGIVAIVLKYRLPNGHYNLPLADAQRVVRMVRAYAKECGVDTGKVAIMGFSAGGHLASSLATHFDNGNKQSHDRIEHYSCRPDLCILCYPVISMKPGMTHAGSRENLLGKDPSPELENQFSTQLHVKENTPPTIIFLSDDDKSVPPINSIEYYTALKVKNIPASLHVFPQGGHGWGMRTNFKYANEWRSLLLEWLKDYQFVK